MLHPDPIRAAAIGFSGMDRAYGLGGVRQGKAGVSLGDLCSMHWNEAEPVSFHPVLPAKAGTQVFFTTKDTKDTKKRRISWLQRRLRALCALGVLRGESSASPP
jgi:hypothetical protein